MELVIPTTDTIKLIATSQLCFCIWPGEMSSFAATLAKEFKLMPREAELSLQQFFKELGRRGYVMFMKSTP